MYYFLKIRSGLNANSELRLKKRYKAERELIHFIVQVRILVFKLCVDNEAEKMANLSEEYHGLQVLEKLIIAIDQILTYFG